MKGKAMTRKAYIASSLAIAAATLIVWSAIALKI